MFVMSLQKALEIAPSEFIVGSARSNDEDGADLDDDTQVCSCHVCTLILVILILPLTVASHRMLARNLSKKL